MITDMVVSIENLVKELLGIELLDFHNKHHLYYGTNPTKLSLEKQELLNSILYRLSFLRKEIALKEKAKQFFEENK